MDESGETVDAEVVVVGAGLSGIGMAIALRADGHEDIVVLERAAELGGTWRDNTYPGCACDVPSVVYSYAGEPNPGWTRGFALQPEIRDYIRRVAAEHGIEPLIRFGHELTGASWDEAAGRWSITTSRGRFRAEILVSAAGALADPKLPDIPGLETFAGTVFHSARWDHEHDLAGRSVAVIGTGASAIQFVPEIQPEVGRLTLFQRTAPWVLPRDNPEIPESLRRRFARHPGLQRALRRLIFGVLETTTTGFRHPGLMRLVELAGRFQIARQVADRELRRRLVPSFALGCKRILFSKRWYPAITAANASVVTAPIREIVPDGIRDGNGRHHAVDTIILATGFHVTDLPIAERLRGRAGETLTEAWAGSPRAHLGMSVRGFPNLFFLLGPNTGLGNNSVLLMSEAQIGLLRELLRHRARWGYRTIEPTAEAQARFVAEVDRDNAGSVWTTGGCASWYLDRNGRQSTLWPLTVGAYQRRLAHFVPGEWAVETPDPAPEPALA